MPSSTRDTKKHAKARQASLPQSPGAFGARLPPGAARRQGLGAGSGGVGPPHRPGGRDRRPSPEATEAVGQDHRCDVSAPLWLSHQHRTVSRAGLGQKSPSRLLGALPKRSWLKRLRRLGLEVLVPLWRHAASKSEATRSRWQWTWVGDDSVFKKYGEQLGLVGTWWSGQEHRVLSGIDGVLLVVVIGEGKLVVPVDFAIRRPDPHRPWGAVPRQTALAPGHAGWTHGGFPPTRRGTAPADGRGR